MLKHVFIKNFAIVDEISLDFQAGLNVFTGETGAGKSIIVGAIGALLGEKIPAAAIRNGASKAIIEGEFDISYLPRLHKLLQDAGLLMDDFHLILRREINAAGRSRAFINDSPVKLHDLTTCSALLLDLHGQHTHQSLLHVKAHLDFLDAYGSTFSLREKVGELYKNAENLRKELASLSVKQNEVRANEDFLKFQLQEIESVAPEPGEEEILLQDEKKLANAHAILEKIDTINHRIYDDENSAISAISQSISLLQELGAIDSQLGNTVKDVESVVLILEELVRSLQSYAGKIDTDSDQLEMIRNRLADFSFLKKKYGPTIENVLEQRQKFVRDLAQIQSLDDEIADKNQAWSVAVESFKKQAIALSNERQKSVKNLQKKIPQILATMGMPHTKFHVEISQKNEAKSWFEIAGTGLKANASGFDQVEFFIKTNPGQATHPLVQIASGGEVSRIMLALKSVIAHAVQIPVLLFDEIDTGVSGRVAHAVGQKLRELAKSHQIICITHLPQIAGAGDFHYLVEKRSDQASASTHVRLLKDDEREHAIAQLLAGKEISETHIASARELLK